MKKLAFLLFVILFSFSTQGQVINITDSNFKAALIAEGVDSNNDGEIQIPEAESITSLNISFYNISSLEEISFFKNINSLYCVHNNIESLDVSNLLKLEILNAAHNEIENLILPDNNVLQELEVDYNKISNIDLSNKSNLEKLYVGYNKINDIDESILNKLKYFNYSGYNLTDFNTSKVTNIEVLILIDNKISSIDLSPLTNLESIYINNNNLTEINVTKNLKLKYLSISNNQISQLDLSISNELLSLNCDSNELTDLDISNNPKISYLNCSYNKISTLDIRKLTNLNGFYCNNNLLKTLDLSKNNNLNYTNISNNRLLEFLFLKNGRIESYYNTNRYTNRISDSNTALKYICVDEFEKSHFDQLNENATVNSFCSFTPGGEVYYVKGNIKLDKNSNGCDTNDINFEDLSIKVTDSFNTTASYSVNKDGTYELPLPEGEYTIEPQLTNPNYFSTSINTFTVNFPETSSPYNQDICLSTKGTFNDVEISILPIDVARPGFDADYKIVYKNVGTTSLSGSINLAYNDNVLDFVSSNTSVSSQNIGELNWEYTDLEPTEKREILYTMNLNSPVETPSLNSGDILTYIVLINPTENEEVVINNTFTLNQEVVNSYDPNDKTCLQGNFATPDIIGEYVHYLIHFENLGTASAINVVVKDVIDTEKFDLSTLEIYDYSHPLKSRIRNTNEVEFIFEGINLPFEDALNDGYIAFKIKTLNSLVIGDTFENKAEIYFDYNAPIVTNNEQTTIESFASLDEFSQSSGIEIFPNPASNLLNIESKTQFDSLVIYDLTGRELIRFSLKESLLKNVISTKNLAIGVYYISIESGKSKKLLQFIIK